VKTSDILNQIDQTLDDWLSPDAMRSRPAPEGEPAAAAGGVVATSGQVWLAPVGTEAGDDGWQRLDGISSVEIHEDVATVEITPDTEPLNRALQAAAGSIRSSTDMTIDPSAIDPNAGQTTGLTWGDLAAAIQQAEEARARYAEAALRHIGRALERIAQHSGNDSFQHLPEADGCNECSDPAEPPQRPRPPLPRRDGRPARQSPYGPGRRR
jgi:hypothetical protein